jgi:hypothetical protein
MVTGTVAEVCGHLSHDAVLVVFHSFFGIAPAKGIRLVDGADLSTLHRVVEGHRVA